MKKREETEKEIKDKEDDYTTRKCQMEKEERERERMKARTEVKENERRKKEVTEVTRNEPGDERSKRRVRQENYSFLHSRKKGK